MSKQSTFSVKDINFFIFISMLFAICTILSFQLNYFFINISILGIKFPFNVSVIFFCICFFILDLVTEIYNNKIADYFIYSKIISQFLFILFGNISVNIIGSQSDAISILFGSMYYTLFCSMVATFITYKLSSKTMQTLKIKFKGNFLFSRYNLTLN